MRNKVILYLVILFMMVGAAFYCSDMRRQTENFLFDFTVRNIPTLKASGTVATIAMDSGSLSTQEKTDLLVSTIRKANSDGVRFIYATYLLSEYPYQRPLPAKLGSILEQNTHIRLMTLALNQKYPISLDFPSTLRPYKNNIVGVDTLRNRSYGIVRSVPTVSYRGLEQSHLLAYELLRMRGEEQPLKRVALRKSNLIEFETNDPEKLPDLSSYEYVFIGQKKYKPWVSQTVEPPTVNTPFQHNTYDVSKGSTILSLAAQQAENIASKKEIKILSIPIAVIAQCFMALFIIWALARTPTVFTFVPFILLLTNMVISLILAHFFSLYLPSADFAFCTLAAQIILAAMFAETQFLEREKESIKQREQQKLDSVYALFISDLAKYLMEKNRGIQDALARITQTGFNSSQAGMLSGTKKSATQFNEFLEGISTLANLDVGSMDDGPARKVGLKKLAKKVCDRFVTQANQQSIRFINYIDDGLTINTNPEILDAILQNLLSNAVKYSPRDRKIEISAQASAGNIHIHIKDYGFGIDDSHHEKIFEKFYRIKDDHVYAKKGSGIGLYLSKAFAQHIGGDVSLVSSKPGEGSHFSIKVPKNA